jgi:hypothetical protein
MNIQISDYAKKINELHGLIGVQLRTPLNTAIEIGKLLSEVKETVGHGNFIQWINDNCYFDERTCQRYIKLFEYKNKTDSVSDLQEAYKQIETIEKQEKQTELQRKNSMINEYIKTGVKPSGWDRSCDYEYQKRKKEDEERTKRIEDTKQKMNAESQKNKQHEEIKQTINDDFTKLFEDIKDETEKDYEFRKKHLSNVTDLNSFYKVIDDYILTLHSNTFKIEALNSIIKYCRDKANALHRL